MISDNDSVMYDIMLKSAHIALQGDYNSSSAEEMMSNLKKMIACDITESGSVTIKTGESSSENVQLNESALLTSYNKVMEGYPKGLEKVLSFTAEYKNSFVKDYSGAGVPEREASFSEINRDYVLDLQTILACYGYTGD